ncbi:MAG: FAD-dependent oxidoreductase [Dehalococcoidales bacterium]|nr:FAD-dependent oxidoreductase [Dehalococcoidales bacterium]
MTATRATNYLQGLSDNIVVDPRKCIFCAKCVDTCILDNLRLQLAPCRQECPLHTNCQGYVQLIARGEDEKAMAVLAEALPFPGIVGRVCSHPCESACNRRDVDGEAVSIRDLKRYLADNVGLPAVEVAPDRPEKVAVVGAGPAGAMASYLLRKDGFQVDLYDANERPGGMLATGVPEFRLPVEVLDKEMDILSQLGVRLHLGQAVGPDLPLASLVEGHDAVLLATGAQKSKKLGVEGEELAGVHGGLEFLRQARTKAKPALGRKVVVIGGGNTAVDAAQTAYRLGADAVTLVCLEARGEMPAFAWEVADACEEGIAIQNSWGPVRLLGTGGKVNGVELRRCVRVFDSAGRFAPAYDDADRKQIRADTVVVAIGQDADLSLLSGLVGQVGNRLAVDALTLQAEGQAKVFAAGDAVTGPKTVVEALAAGQQAAESIKRYLAGDDLRYGRSYLGPYETDFAVDTSKAVQRPRVAVRKAEGAARRSFAELQQGMSAEEARAEAERCLSCGEVYGKHRTCWFCLPCEIECPEDALWVDIPYLLR